MSRSDDWLFKLWSLPDGELLTAIEKSLPRNLTISPDSTMLLASDRLTIRLWSLPDGALLHTFEGHDIRRIAVSPDSSTLFVGKGKESTIELWSLPDGTQLNIIKAYEDYVGDFVISPDGMQLISSGDDGIIKFWSLPDGTLLNTIKAYEDYDINDLIINADGSLLVSSTWGDTVKVWSLPDGNLMQTLDIDGRVHSLAISPDSTLLVSRGRGGYRTIQLWSLPDGKYLCDLIDMAASTKYFEGVQYSPGDEGTSIVTLPAGSTIPAGVTCICNTVTGSACECVGYVCSCDGHTSSGGGGGGHYWYPN